MLKRVVIGVSLACLMGGAAYAADEPPPTAAPAEGDDQCSQQLATTEAAVQSKVEANALSEADTDKVNELLDQADAVHRGRSGRCDQDTRRRLGHACQDEIASARSGRRCSFRAPPLEKDTRRTLGA